VNGLVLVADDSRVVRAAVRRELERAGFEVLEAADGVEAAVLALGRRPDVVVTDLEMPLVSGTQLALLLREDPATRDIPIVVLTGHAEAPLRFWSLHTGADRFVAKDEGFAGVVRAVRELIAEAGGRKEREASGGPPREMTAVEVLARVARRLDEQLMEATLVAMLLRRGTGAESVETAARAVFEVTSAVIGVEAMALVVTATGPIQAFVWLERPAAPEHLGRLVAATARAGDVEGPLPDRPVVLTPPDAPARADGPPRLEPLYPLRLRGGRLAAVLGTVPRHPSAFAETPSRLLGALAPHIALVLDAAHLAERLVELSTVDDLTGVLNHRAILEWLQREVERRRRYGGGLAVILADLDRFKRVNDEYGHLAGDAVLRAAASALREGLRQVDAVGRYGGEEFLAVLPETGLEEARRVAERLRARLASREVVTAGARIRVTASFGVAAAEELDGPDVQALIGLADDRLYEAKRAGRDRVCP